MPILLKLASKARLLLMAKKLTFDRYDDSKPSTRQKFLDIRRIVVGDERTKSQLIMAFKLLHDSGDLDSEIIALNHIMHLYQDPDLIVVDATASCPRTSEASKARRRILKRNVV